ncbi:MAG: hypothetical protein WAU91_05115 [Desulfatitalea sp.]
MTLIYVATEDALSEAVADRIVREVNQGLHVAVRVGRKGNSYLRKRFVELSETARNIPVLLLTDLDRIPCASTLIDQWSRGRMSAGDMLFRVAVRETEAWLLADREGFAHFAGIPKAKLPRDPELLHDPKQTLLDLVRRFGRREIKTNLLPGPGSTAKIGFGYNLVLGDFVRDHWSVRSAAIQADSLERTCRRLRELSLRKTRC